MSSHQLSMLSSLPSSSLPSLLPLLLAGTSLSSRAPRAFTQRICVATRLDDEAAREAEEGDTRWSRTRRARNERLEVCSEEGQCTLQLPSLPLPARQGAPSAPGAPNSASAASSSSIGGVDVRAAVTIRQTTSVELLSASSSASASASSSASASTAAAPGAELPEPEEWDAWRVHQASAFDVDEARRTKHEAWEQEAQVHCTEALYALGWRPLHTYRRHGLRFVLRDDGAKGRFEVCVYRLYHDDLSLPSPAPNTLVVHARVTHAVSAPPAGASASGISTPTGAAPTGAASATAAVLDAGIRELESLARRCAGVCVFGRDE